MSKNALSNAPLIVATTVLCTVLFGSLSFPRAADAGLTQAAIQLAAPLAEQFGVPSSAVTALLDKGLSLDSVTQLLLVSQSSKQKLDDVTRLYDQAGQDITKTADQLKVAASDYSPDKVSAAIDQAKAKAQADAANQANDAANRAVGSALGGLK